MLLEDVLSFLRPEKMVQFSTIADMGLVLESCRVEGRSIGFVPTMGALHKGHLSLVSRAKAENDMVICSVFVNPTQFNDKADLDKYPRPLADDLKKLGSAHCDLVFTPDEAEMYAQKEQWELDLNGLDKVLEGAHRPGHFRGVTQIVYKLLAAVGPSTVYFGQKDYQQFRIISYMVQKFNLQNKLVRCPIIREPDGLAMSSRNVHLSDEDRKHALILSKAIDHVSRNILANPQGLEEAKQMIIQEKAVWLDYLELVGWSDLQAINPVTVAAESDEIAVVVAAKVGQTRLIDNAIVKPGEISAGISQV